MDDWQAGDDALCIAQLWIGPDTPAPIRPGEKHHVIGVRVEFCTNCGEQHEFLEFAAFPRQGFESDAFVKLRPHEEDEDDREVIRLLKGAPVEERV